MAPHPLSRALIAALPVLLWCACSPDPIAPGTLLPPAIGNWQRSSLHDSAPSLPGAQRAFRATYDGPGRIAVTVEQFKTPGVAFETAQHWRPLADTVSFDKGPFFVAVKWDHVDRPALTAFVRELESAIGRAAPR